MESAVSSKKPARSDIVQQVMDAGRELGARTVLFHEAVAQQMGLTPTLGKCLDLLVRNGPLTAGQLADVTGLTTGAITGIIDRLEETGYVRRVRDPEDRRRVFIEPVMERINECADLFGPMVRAWQDMYADYTVDELVLVRDFIARSSEVLTRVTKLLRDTHDGAAPESRAVVSRGTSTSTRSRS
jgi:DNA-binding MarR family transcriptional regulator